MKKPGLGLFANVGAEDADLETPSPRARDITAVVTELWSMLFAAHARFLPYFASPTPWPAAFGERPDDGAFPWSPAAGGVPWLSTPQARSAVRKVGLELEAPAPEVVRKVHDKAYARDVAARLDLVPPPLTELSAVFEAGELRDQRTARAITALVAAWPAWTRGRYVLKPRWGTSGRGGFRGDPTIAVTDRALQRLALRGGAVLEPWLDRVEDLSALMFVGADGEVELLGTTSQVLSSRGTPRGNHGVIVADGPPRAGSAQHDALVVAALAVAKAAADGGFRGPCGVDAFTFIGPDGIVSLRPLVELNARYTVGIVALGLVARALGAGLARVGDQFLLSLGDAPAGWSEADGARRLELAAPAALYLK